jgi:hypothetical protein
LSFERSSPAWRTITSKFIQSLLLSTICTTQILNSPIRRLIFFRTLTRLPMFVSFVLIFISYYLS